MKNSKTTNLAAIISLIIMGFYLLATTIIDLISINFQHLLFSIIFSVLLFIFSYFIVKYVLEKFVYDKIKPIYKTILSFKSPNGVSKKPPDNDSDIISSVNQQVIKWAEDKKEEIAELKKLEAYRREFLGNVSHELKTPIFNIQGYVLTLLDGGLYDPAINKEYLLRTEKSINRMIHIVQDLEAISKLESGELKLTPERFDILLLIKEVFEFLERVAEKSQIKLMFGANYDKAVFVNADKEKIRQVLINLVENSIKYGIEGGFTKISFFDMDENLLIEVTDNGIGIAQQDIPRLFERFFRTDKGRSREQSGTGLGLAIVKHIIEAHHQTINVRSTIGIGTTFAFTLKKG